MFISQKDSSALVVSLYINFGGDFEVGSIKKEG